MVVSVGSIRKTIAAPRDRSLTDANGGSVVQSARTTVTVTPQQLREPVGESVSSGEREMPVVSGRQRLGALRSLGISAAVVELAAGNNRRATFDYYCTPPYMIYDCPDAPAGHPLVPLWEDRGGGATAVRPGETGLEFVQFSVEALVVCHA